MVVETIKKGEFTIIIHDDSYAGKTPEEIRQIIQNASAIVYASGRKQAVGATYSRNPLRREKGGTSMKIKITLFVLGKEFLDTTISLLHRLNFQCSPLEILIFRFYSQAV